eukprot:gene27426-36199_t
MHRKLPYTKPPAKKKRRIGGIKGIKDFDDENEPIFKLLIEPKTGKPLNSNEVTSDEDMKAAVVELRMRQEEFVDIKFRIKRSLRTDIIEQLNVIERSSLNTQLEEWLINAECNHNATIKGFLTVEERKYEFAGGIEPPNADFKVDEQDIELLRRKTIHQQMTRVVADVVDVEVWIDSSSVQDSVR